MSEVPVQLVAQFADEFSWTSSAAYKGKTLLYRHHYLGRRSVVGGVARHVGRASRGHASTSRWSVRRTS
jgi:hypothetical protein